MRLLKSFRLRSFVLLAMVCAPTSGAWALTCALDLPEEGAVSLQQFSESAIDDQVCRGSKFKKFRSFMEETMVLGIPGYNNETNRLYFGQLKMIVENLGGSFRMVRTNSKMPIDLDTPSVCRELGNYMANMGEGGTRKRITRAVIFGHSKGGGTALYMFHPKAQGACYAVIGSSKLAAVVSVNGVIGGSEFADGSTGDLETDKAKKTFIGKSIRQIKQAAARILTEIKFDVANCALLTMFLGSSEAGVSLTSKESAIRVSGIPTTRGMMHCVATHAPKESYTDPNSKAGKMAKYLDFFKDPKTGEMIPNDGLVSFGKQFDKRLCPLNLEVPGANHMALFEGDDSDPNVSNRARRAFAAHMLYRIMLGLEQRGRL